MFFIWYCFDDHLATIFANPAIGHIPWWIILLSHLFLATLTIRRTA